MHHTLTENMNFTIYNTSDSRGRIARKRAAIHITVDGITEISLRLEERCGGRLACGVSAWGNERSGMCQQTAQIIVGGHAIGKRMGAAVQISSSGGSRGH